MKGSWDNERGEVRNIRQSTNQAGHRAQDSEQRMEQLTSTEPGNHKLGIY